MKMMLQKHPPEVLFKKDLENFPKFAGNYLCQSFFNRDSDAGVFLYFLRDF